jgi:hypothetical protein
LDVIVLYVNKSKKINFAGEFLSRSSISSSRLNQLPEDIYHYILSFLWAEIFQDIQRLRLYQELKTVYNNGIYWLKLAQDSTIFYDGWGVLTSHEIMMAIVF